MILKDIASYVFTDKILYCAEKQLRFVNGDLPLQKNGWQVLTGFNQKKYGASQA